MSNLTVVIDEDLLRTARIKALQQGTSVNEICREAIARFAAPADDHGAWMQGFRSLSSEISREARKSGGAGKAEPLWPGREILDDELMAGPLPPLPVAPEARQRKR